ncbi:unnamed protein product [Effrenium voratum]|nr:unnamed protein product [Effrenium voratum]
MSQQKEEAERYRTMEEEKRNLQAEFVLFRLCCTESSAQEIAESIQDARKELEEMQAAQKAVTAALEASEKRRAQVQLATGETERRLAAAKSRLEQVRPEHLQVRGELLAAQRRQEEILSHQEMDLERRRRLSEQAEELSAQVARLQEELRALNAARHEAPFSEEQWQRFREAQGEAERRTSAQCQEAKDLEQKLASARRLRAARQLDRREVQLQVRHLSQKVEDLTSSCSGLRSVHEHTAADAAKRRAEVEVLQEGRKQQGASRQKLEEERRKIMEEIQNITATERQIEHERRLTHICQDLGQLSGVQGRAGCPIGLSDGRRA